MIDPAKDYVARKKQLEKDYFARKKKLEKYYNKAVHYCNEQEFRKALLYYDLVLYSPDWKINRDIYDLAFHGKFSMFVDMNKFLEARETCLEALRKDPLHADAQAKLGLISNEIDKKIKENEQ